MRLQMSLIKLLLLSLAICLQTLVAHAGTEPEEPLILSFGVYRSDKATVMYKKFLPVLKRLSDDIGSRMARDVEIRLRIFQTYDQGIDAIVKGEVDFARTGPASYIIAKRKNHGLRLLVIEERKGKRFFDGVIVVATNSTFKSLADLKGSRIAFGDQNSTIGHFLAQAELVKAGLHSHDFTKISFLGRHDKVYKAVSLGDYDVGALKETTYNRLNKGGVLRIIHRFKNVTKPWFARSGLNHDTEQAIQEILLAIKDKTILRELKVSGFLPVKDDDFKIIRQGMELEKLFDDQQVVP